MKITIISIFRDSEKTIHNCLKQLDELEKNTKASFEYFFYENDSKDKTKEILDKWMDNKIKPFRDQLSTMAGMVR